MDHTLRHAGGKGWSQVYSIRLYTTRVDETCFNCIVDNLKKWVPDHQPILTVPGVAQLGLPGMNIEIEVAAIDEEGAETAAIPAVDPAAA